MTWNGDVAFHCMYEMMGNDDMKLCDMTSHDIGRRDMVWLIITSPDTAWHSMTWHDHEKLRTCSILQKINIITIAEWTHIKFFGTFPFDYLPVETCVIEFLEISERLWMIMFWLLPCAGFTCFRAFLENVNQNDHRIKKSGNTYTVEKMDLVGLDYLWRVVLEVPSEEIAMLAVKQLMELSYTWLSSKLKKVSISQRK